LKSQASEKIIVAITTNVAHRGFERLSPGSRMKWGKCRFLLNPPPGTEVDYWIVFTEGRTLDYMTCHPQNTLFLAGEPPSKKIHSRSFYAQFHQVVSSHENDPHPRVTAASPGLNWHVGLQREQDCYSYGYDELVVMPFPQKRNQISVVCSNLATTQGQRDRLNFLEQLKSALGEQLVHFGRGFDPISDKMDAILPYRFHLVLENSCSANYWTEKISDAYLGWAFPFYAGCPNLDESFPSQSFVRVLLNEPEAAISSIRLALSSPQDRTEIELISQSRDLALNQFNLFARFSKWAELFHSPLPRQKVYINTHKAYRPFPKNMIFRIKSRFKGIQL
jgi:hypothetical protein